MTKTRSASNDENKEGGNREGKQRKGYEFDPISLDNLQKTLNEFQSNLEKMIHDTLTSF